MFKHTFISPSFWAILSGPNINRIKIEGSGFFTMASVEAFIRFVDVSGAVNYGAIKPTQLHQTASLKGIAVERLLGDPFKGFTPSGKTDAVEKVTLKHRWQVPRTVRGPIGSVSIPHIY